MNNLRNLVYRISGHESSSSASATGSNVQELSNPKTPPRKTEYIETPVPVTSVDELAYLKP